MSQRMTLVRFAKNPIGAQDLVIAQCISADEKTTATAKLKLIPQALSIGFIQPKEARMNHIGTVPMKKSALLTALNRCNARLHLSSIEPIAVSSIG